MAVAPMLRVSVIGYRPVMDEVVERLQRAGVLDIVTDDAGTVPQEEVAHDDPRLRRLEAASADAYFVREFLGRYHTPEAPLSTFVSEKVHVSVDEFEALEADESHMALYRNCVDLSDRLATLGRERERLTKLVAELRPWTPLHLQLSSWQGTEHTVLFAGTVPASGGPAIRARLREAVTQVTVEEVAPVGARQAWVVIAHQTCLAEVRAILATVDFNEVTFTGMTDYPAEELAAAEERLSEIETETHDLTARAAALAKKHYHEGVALYEALESRKDALTIRERFGATERAFVVHGWVRERSRQELDALLAPLAEDLDIAFRPPTAEDEPPVELDNPRLLKPFELLTDLYGRPRYREIDPTPLLAPFFLTFFAITISDVGYGAMLIGGAWLIKTRLDVAPGVKRFMDLLMTGGVGAMIVGVLFGSYLALPAESLPSFLRALQVLDPLNELTTFLLFTVVLGVIQVFFGVFVAAYDAFRRGDPGEAISQQLSTVFLFSMLAVAAFVPGAARWAIVIGIGLTMILQGKTLAAVRNPGALTPGEDADQPRANAVGRWDSGLTIAWLVLLVAWLVDLAFAGPAVVGWVLAAATVAGLVLVRGIRRSVVALLGGAYAVYGMTSFIGDILSYTRLAALGLSGVLVGMVFNILAGLVWTPALDLLGQGGFSIVFGVLVALAAATIFVVGHVFNVVINLLGAFVHPARLQFVEFFSKFYEGGGRWYTPFGFKTKSLVLHAGQSARQEGGVG